MRGIIRRKKHPSRCPLSGLVNRRLVANSSIRPEEVSQHAHCTHRDQITVTKEDITVSGTLVETFVVLGPEEGEDSVVEENRLNRTSSPRLHRHPQHGAGDAPVHVIIRIIVNQLKRCVTNVTRRVISCELAMRYPRNIELRGSTLQKGSFHNRPSYGRSQRSRKITM